MTRYSLRQSTIEKKSSRKDYSNRDKLSTTNSDVTMKTHDEAVAAGGDGGDSDIDSELETLFCSLSPESKALAKIITKVTDKLKDEIQSLKVEVTKKDQKITELTTKVKELADKVQDLEFHIDEVEQYERRDAVIISGPSLPAEAPGENPTNVVLDTVKQCLKISMTNHDISVAHRLGQKNNNKDHAL